MSRLPEGWTKQKLGCYIQPVDERSTGNDEYPTLTSSRSGLHYQEEYFSKRVASTDNSGYKILRRGQFTYRAMSDDGAFKFNRLDFCEAGLVSPAYDVFEVIGCQPEFFEKLLNSPFVARGVNANSQGGTRLSLKVKALSQIEVPFPSLAEQQKIAEILGSVDDALAATRRVIAHTRQLKRAMLQQLLTQGLPGRHTQFKDSPLGRIPAEWEVKALGEVVEFYNGKAHEADISDEGKFIVVNSKFISTDGEVKKFSNKSYLPALTGDILIVMSDIPNGRALARVFFVNEENLYTVNQRVGLLRSKKDNPEFLGLCLNRHPHFLSFNDGVKQTNLRKEEVLSCPLAIPSNIKEQKDIVSIIENIDAIIQCNTVFLYQLEQSKNSLLHKLLSGEIRVTVNSEKRNPHDQ